MNPVRNNGESSGKWGTNAYVALAMILVSLMVVIYVGGIKNRLDWICDYDTQFWYVGGTMIRDGVSPFENQVFLATWEELYGVPPRFGGAFVYPPTIYTICVPLAFLPWEVAVWALRIGSFLAFYGICYFAVRFTQPSCSFKKLSLETWFLIAACGLLGSVTQTMTQGQLGLIVVWGLTAMLYAWQRGKWILFVAGFVVATIKPQLTLFPILFIYFAGGHWRVIVGVLAAGIFSLMAVVSASLKDFPQFVIESLRAHASIEHNKPIGYESLPALFGSAHFARTALLVGILIGCCLVVWIAFRHRRAAMSVFSDSFVRHLQIVLALVPALMPLHRYDFVIHLPLVLSLGVIPGRWRRIFILILILLHERLYKLEFLVARLTDDSVTFMYHMSSLMSGALLVVLVGFFVSDIKGNRLRTETEAVDLPSQA